MAPHLSLETSVVVHETNLADVVIVALGWSRMAPHLSLETSVVVHETNLADVVIVALGWSRKETGHTTRRFPHNIDLKKEKKQRGKKGEVGNTLFTSFEDVCRQLNNYFNIEIKKAER